MKTSKTVLKVWEERLYWCIIAVGIVTNGGGGSFAVWGARLDRKERKASFLAPS